MSKELGMLLNCCNIHGNVTKEEFGREERVDWERFRAYVQKMCETRRVMDWMTTSTRTSTASGGSCGGGGGGGEALRSTCGERWTGRTRRIRPANT